MLTYENEVRRLLCKVLDLSSADHIPLNEDLQGSGMDSLNCMELTIALEDTFHITIPDERLGLQYIRNIRDICQLIEEIKTYE